MKAIPIPTNAVTALRLARSSEKAIAALKNGTFTSWFNAARTICVMDSWKVRAGKNVCDRYYVDMEKGTCTCTDFAQHLNFCKHTIGAEIENEATDEAQMWAAQCERAEADAQYA